MNLPRHTLTLALTFAASVSQASLTFLGQFSATSSGGEIVSFDPATKDLLVTRSAATANIGVTIFNINDAGTANYTTPTSTFINVTTDTLTNWGNAANVFGVSSTAADPMGRGFGVVAIIPAIAPAGNPTFNTDYSTQGKLAFFNTSTGAILNSVDIGFHPDAVTFSPDGSKILVANEAEFNGTTGLNQRNGSLSVINLASISNVTDIASLTNSAVTTVDLSAATLPPNFRSISGVSSAGVNFTETVVQAIEPEYVTVKGSSAYVTLQENNAIGVFDLNTNTWTQVRDLGTVSLTTDLTSNATIETNRTVAAMPMPDAIANFTVAGTTYLVTANEGDVRGADEAELVLGSQFGTAGYPSLDPSVPNQADYLTGGPLANTQFSAINGDVGGDGDIDVPTLFGSRGFTITDAITGATIFNSGDFIETWIKDNNPGGWADGRAISKGPEPEGLTVGEIGGKPYLFVSTERTNHLFMFDISDPNNPVLVDATATPFAYAGTRPEGMSFVPADVSPSGQNILIVGFEGNDRVAVFQVVPEPSTWGVMLGAAVLMVGAYRRRLARK